MRNMEVLGGDHSFALRCPDYVDARVLVAATAETFAVPTGAFYVVFSSNVDFFASYMAASADAVTNGAFAADASWTKGTGWAISGGKATSDASQAGNSDLTQSFSSLVVGKAYRVVFTVSGYSAGNVRALVGGGTGTNRAADGTFTETVIAGSSDLLIGVRADLDFAGSIDNLSVTPVASAPSADITTGGASELNPDVRFLGTDVGQLSLYSDDAGIITMAFFK